MKEWRQNITNFITLLHKKVCGICLSQRELRTWNTYYVTENNTVKMNLSLKDMLSLTFGFDMISLTATGYFCEKCISTIIKSYFLKEKLKSNHENIQKYCKQIIRSIDGNICDEKRELNIILNNNLEMKNVENTTIDYTNGDIFDDLDPIALDCTYSEIKQHSNTQTYEYPYCEQDFEKFHHYTIHYENYHTKEFSIECKECMIKFNSIKTLVKHRNRIHSEYLSFCNCCNVILAKTEKTKHIIEYHNNSKFVCDICEKSFITKRYIEKHINLRHNNSQQYLSSLANEAEFKTYKCTECTKELCIHKKYLSSLKHQHNSGQLAYKCIDCDYACPSKYKLISHVNKEHLDHNPHLCHLCGKKFPSKYLLRYHSNKHTNTFNCQFCYKGFKDENCLKQHIPICEITDRPYICVVCKLEFTTAHKLEFHRRKHFPKEMQCSYCSKRYWTKSELTVHLKRLHRDKINNIRKMYQCTKCPADLESKKDFQKHSSSHSEDSKHRCRICSNSFQSKTNYYSHMRKHNIKKDRECPVCLRFYTKYSINRHLQTHSKQDSKKMKVEKKCHKNILCNICGALLSNEKTLVIHSETHKEQKQCPNCLKFINIVLFEKHLNSHENKTQLRKRKRKVLNCPKCAYTSNFSECLEAHMNRYHLHVRPFQCDICKKCFYAKLTLKDHIKTHTVSKPEQCDQCGNTFASKKALKLHVRIHTGEKPYACDLCDEKFLSASRRQEHRIRKHFEPSVQCQICLKMYYTQRSLRVHVLKCHSGEPKSRKKRGEKSS